VSFEDEHDINTITGLLKLYFRELRNPLMTYEYYDYFMEAARITDYEGFMYEIKSIIHSLPAANYATLETLMRHLNRVASHSEVNKMEASNLALIFSVGLLRSSQENFSGIMMSDLQSKIIEVLIQQVDWFFEKEQEQEEEA
ncbi:Rho GTPase activation protein, partial [Pilobolus umbonatus]